MGDHRADIQITFAMHGKTYKMDSYVNWFDNGYGIDDRIVEFFRESVADAMDRYDAKVAEYFKDQHEQEQAAADRIEYERLKAKFSGAPEKAEDS